MDLDNMPVVAAARGIANVVASSVLRTAGT